MYAEDYTRQVVTEDYLNDWSFNATTPGNHTTDPCRGTYIQLGDWTINSPSLIPTCKQPYYYCIEDKIFFHDGEVQFWISIIFYFQFF